MNNLKQGTHEWREWRNSKIGSSDAPIIMEVSPWQNPYDLWRKKMGLLEEFPPNYAMEHGIQTEPEARAQLEKILGVALLPTIEVSEEYPWMIASLDGKSLGDDLIVEIKCPVGDSHKIVKEIGKVPDHYFPQLQHAMYVTKKEEMIYFSYQNGEGIILEVKKDPSYQKILVEKEKEFYDRLQSFNPPEETSSFISKKGDFRWEEEARLWEEAYKNYKKWEKIVEEKRKTLIGMAEGQSCKGGGIVCRKTVAKGPVDYKSIPELKGINLEDYRKQPVEKWTIQKEKHEKITSIS